MIDPQNIDDGNDVDISIADSFEEESSSMAEMIELTPTRADLNERLDKFIAEHIKDLSRSYIQQLIDDERVTVDGIVRRRTFKMTPGQVVNVSVPPPEIDNVEPENIPLDIVYEDRDVIVIDKPAGMVVHPAAGHPRGTLVNALLYHAPEISVAGSNRPGIVHRLDKDTSGLIVVAKSDRARVTLVKQWNSRSVEKRYMALVRGVVEENEATIDVPIGRDPTARSRMAVVAGTRNAITHFAVIERFAEATFLDVEIVTGRTHQIRVHLAFIGHPVVGDSTYNRFSGVTGAASSIVDRQFLHAATLSFVLPDGQSVRFEAPLPADLVAALETLRAERSTASVSA